MTVLNNVIYWFLLEVKFVKFGLRDQWNLAGTPHSCSSNRPAVALPCTWASTAGSKGLLHIPEGRTWA